MKIDRFFAEVVKAAVWTEREMEKELDKEVDAGRFNPESETPLLSAEEDQNDFQLFSETPKEAAKREQVAKKAEADKLERAKAEARRNAPDLPMETTDHADNTERTQIEVLTMTEDEFLAQRGLSMPVSDHMIDKQKIPHGETESQRKQRIREADRIANEYAEARKKAKAEYREKIKNCEIRKPSEIEKLEKIATGNPENESVKAAKRVLEKRKTRAQSAANSNRENNPDDAGDFQLFAETYVEFRRNEQKAERDAIERAKREREEYKRLAPNLF